MTDRNMTDALKDRPIAERLAMWAPPFIHDDQLLADERVYKENCGRRSIVAGVFTVVGLRVVQAERLDKSGESSD